jgi:hypothetical protein
MCLTIKLLCCVADVCRFSHPHIIFLNTYGILVAKRILFKQSASQFILQAIKNNSCDCVCVFERIFKLLSQKEFDFYFPREIFWEIS